MLLCVAVSFALHAALVVAAATLRSARPSSTAPIHVSLVAGTSGESSGGARAGDATAPAPAQVPPPLDSAPQAVRPNHARPQVPLRRPRAVVNVPQAPMVAVDVAAETALSVVGAGSDGFGHVQEMTENGFSASGPGTSAGRGQGDGLDARAYCAVCPEPTYPLIARSRGWQGTVEVALLVRADGSVNGASLGRSSGYPALDDAAMAVARLSRFHLPNDGGLPAPLRGRMEYRFVLR
ncbi:MAG: TonB family protein [Deltaproteobacteria bacterium]|nr:TonB family protein [Deltaproteobacteria bacterium]